jgi:hypothetical protein
MSSVVLASLPQGTPPELMAVIEGAALKAYYEHGAAAFAAPREAAAAHEAGHAIVGTAEGFRIREIQIQSVPGSPELWGGKCIDTRGSWTTGPNTRADEDLRRARFIIAGLAGEAITGHDVPASSLDELALSQLVGHNAAVKLTDLTQTDEEFSAYEQELWHEQVWGEALSILRDNSEPFRQLAEYLHRHGHVDGKVLRKVLVQVRRRKP